MGAVESLSALQDADALITTAALAQSLPGDAGQPLGLLDRATASARCTPSGLPMNPNVMA